MKPILAAVLALALIAPALAGQNSVPVYARGNGDESQALDACGSSGTVLGLDPNGDGWLAVKAGPGLDFARVDKLYNGQDVVICDQVGPWFGVVYSKQGQTAVSSRPGAFGCRTQARVGTAGSTRAMSAIWLDEVDGEGSALPRLHFRPRQDAVRHGVHVRADHRAEADPGRGRGGAPCRQEQA